MALAGAVFALTDSPILLTIAAILGVISPSGKEVGPFLSIEQVVLSQATSDEQRTSVFAVYNLVGSLAGALGALAAGLPTVLGLALLAGYRVLVWSYAAAGLALLSLFARLSLRVEARPSVSARPQHWLGVQRSRGTVTKLAALFAFDAFAGGFVVQGLVAYWFYLR